MLAYKDKYVWKPKKKNDPEDAESEQVNKEPILGH